ncbi:MAG: site-specific integrase, partial [Chloroflexota bacterium]|nr:site-specific integrase [Chloroflexota bacterium]
MPRRTKGEGAIYRDPRNGKWIGMLDLGWQDGHRVRKTIRGESKRQVADELARLRTDRQRGIIPPTNERTTVSAYLDAWLRDVRGTIRPSTLVSYEGHVRLHIVPRLGRLRLAELGPAHVRALLDADKAPGRSARSLQLTHAVLRRALNQALRDGTVARNVASLVEAPRVHRDEVRPFDPDEARAFLAAVRGDRLEALYTVAIALGLRQGEALGLRWADVDMESGT